MKYNVGQHVWVKREGSLHGISQDHINYIGPGIIHSFRKTVLSWRHGGYVNIYSVIIPNIHLVSRTNINICEDDIILMED